jgi:hypothetical protein
VSTEETNPGYIRRTIKLALGTREVRKVRGPLLDNLYARPRQCGNLACTGKPVTEHRHVPGRRRAAVPVTAPPVVTRHAAPGTAPRENWAWPVLRAGDPLAAKDHSQGRFLRTRRQGAWRKREPLSNDLARQVLGT